MSQQTDVPNRIEDPAAELHEGDVISINIYVNPLRVTEIDADTGNVGVEFSNQTGAEKHLETNDDGSVQIRGGKYDGSDVDEIYLLHSEHGTAPDGAEPGEFRRFKRETLYSNGSSVSVALGGDEYDYALEHAGIAPHEPLEVWAKEGSVRLVAGDGASRSSSGYRFVNRSAVKGGPSKTLKYLSSRTRELSGLEAGEDVIISARTGEIDISRANGDHGDD